MLSRARWWCLFHGLCLAIFLLPACTNVAMTGAQMVYHRQTIQKDWQDQSIALRATRALYTQTSQFNDTSISVTAFHGDVLMVGQAARDKQRIAAERIVKQIAGNNRIYNLVTIGGRASFLVQLSDAWITAKVKAKLLASNELDATQIKVVTENGRVYLMGTIMPSEAKEAVDIARTTAGVEAVVKVFNYIRITKT